MRPARRLCPVLLLFLLAACPADDQQEKAALAAANKKAEAELGLMIKYTAPFRRIVLSPNLHLSDTEEIAEYDNPVAATPSRMTKREKTGQVAEHEAAALLRFIRESGFADLKDVYGAGPEERSYPYQILVRDNDWHKEVLCRSSPAAQPCPKAFIAVQQRIIEFAQQAVQPRKGE